MPFSIVNKTTIGKGARLTFHITPYVGIWALVFIDKLNHAQQVLLVQLFQGVGDLLVVVFLTTLLTGDSLLLLAVIVVG
jgi:hypothetical protein